MSEKPTRRAFVKWTVGSVAGLGLAPFLGAARGAGRGASPSARDSSARTRGRSPVRDLVGDDGLPPRTVGLRSLGGDFAFEPVGLRLEPGARLTWLNMGDFHTATAFHPVNDELLAGGVPLRIPDGARSWHSGMLGLDGGTEFRHSFEVPGVYDYFCQPHYSFGMVGRVVVPPADGATPAARPASELNEASRKEMPAVDAILGAAGRAYEWTSRINGVLLLRAHGEAAGRPAERLADGVTGDRRLFGLLERAGEGDRTLASLERFVDAVRADVGYETLAGRADEAKAPLSAAAEAVG